MDNSINTIIENLKLACEFFSETTTQERRDELLKDWDFGSFIIGDDDGVIYEKCKCDLEQSVFTVKTINLIEPKLSTPYNPFSPQYLETDSDIIRLASIMVDTAVGKSDPIKPYLRSGMKSLLTALIAYVTSDTAAASRSLYGVIEMLKNNSRSDGYGVTQTDTLFDRLKEKDPYCLAAKQYEIYRNSDWDNLNFISDYLLKLLYFYENDDISSIILADDEMDIKSFAEKPTVLFFITPAHENIYVPFTQTAYFQLESILSRQKSRVQDGLPIIEYSE